MRKITALVAGIGMLVAGCATTDDTDALEKRITQLTNRVAEAERFTAAITDVNDRLLVAEQEVAELRADVGSPIGVPALGIGSNLDERLTEVEFTLNEVEDSLILGR